MTEPHKHHGVVIAMLNGKKAQYLYNPIGEWKDPECSAVNPLSCPHLEWRVAPETIKIGRHEVPKAMTEAPSIGEWYWISQSGLPLDSMWRGDEIDMRRLAAGEVYATKEDVTAAIAFYPKFRRGEIDFSGEGE
ncbi:MAG: hypothetical protein ACRCV9_21025 [Burkholderiaceae bacterium]